MFPCSVGLSFESDALAGYTLTWAGPLVPAPMDVSPAGASVEAGLALLVLSQLQDTPQQQSAGKFEKTRFITHRSWGVHGMSGATQ